uniref:hypothetical protein n=1 Tax=Thaumasiovibrio occultus TaxID=1891184 RepID=UPI000B35208C|nr:hypothetical protein [Thaumasiovibrio occultus]
MVLKRPNWIIVLGLLFQLLGLMILSLGVMAINIDQTGWIIYAPIAISLLFIVNGILLFSMKRISIHITGVFTGISAFYQAYDFYVSGEFSAIIISIHFIIFSTIACADKGIFDKEKNPELVKDGKILSQKTKFYSAVVISLAAYVFSGWHAWPKNNGKELVSDFIALSAENNVECHWAGFINHRKTGRTTIKSTCVPLMEAPEMANTKEALLASINKHVITPSISALPLDQNITTLVIVQVAENVVTCSEITEGKIVKSWYDSYDNYCLP